jgi:hypothetical protein
MQSRVVPVARTQSCSYIAGLEAIVEVISGRYPGVLSPCTHRTQSERLPLSVSKRQLRHTPERPDPGIEDTAVLILPLHRIEVFHTGECESAETDQSR